MEPDLLAPSAAQPMANKRGREAGHRWQACSGTAADTAAASAADCRARVAAVMALSSHH